MADHIRITIACPEAHIADANQLARVIGYGPDDGRTCGAALFRDAAGNRYAAPSGLVLPAFVTNAVAPLVEPAWGADMAAAARAQALIVIGGPAAPGQITAVIDDDPQAALAALGLTQLMAGA